MATEEQYTKQVVMMPLCLNNTACIIAFGRATTCNVTAAIDRATDYASAAEMKYNMYHDYTINSCNRWL